MKTIQLTLLNKPGKWAFVKHLLFVSSETAAKTLAQGAIWLARTPLRSSLPIPELRSATAACPRTAGAVLLCRARVIQHSVPLIFSLNISNTSDCDSPPSFWTWQQMWCWSSEWAFCPRWLMHLAAPWQDAGLWQSEVPGGLSATEPTDIFVLHLYIHSSPG